MNGQEIGLALLAAIVLVALFYLIYSFAIAKNAVKKISITNPGGSLISIDAEIADNPFKMMKGLMGRSSLDENAGMLFVFQSEDIQTFWMFNTTIPLDALFIKENGTVAEIIQMEPCGLNVTKCKTYAPNETARYVLEVNKGFSKRHNIIVGKSTVSLS